MLMCSCKTQKNSYDVSSKTKEVVDVLRVERVSLVDTSFVRRIFEDKSKLTINERIVITEYDKDTGAVSKKTETEREITQDTDQVATEEETKGVAEQNNVLVKQESDFSKTLDSEVESESIGGQESFGKWFGIGLACVIGVLFVYLLKKLRVN